jgi:hypothetical protein
MAFSIPDKGEGLSNIQSVFFQEYLDVLVAGISGVDCVFSGCAVTAQVTPDMTVAVASGSIRSNSVTRTVTGANATISASNASNPRLDLVVITSAGAIAVRAGTAATAPIPAARVANDVVLAVVYVPASDTAIQANQIVDLRVTEGSTNVAVTGGSINGTPIGGTTPAAVAATTLSATATIATGVYTVATLPAGVQGQRAYVTDATAPTFLGALTGGGTVKCPVFRNATTWVSA